MDEEEERNEESSSNRQPNWEEARSGCSSHEINEIVNQEEDKKKRAMCSACTRPSTVCICAQLPSSPLHTNTQILILQHPHELRHKLATAPVVPKCLRNCHTILGRRLHLGSSPLLDPLYHLKHQQQKALFLFPGNLPCTSPAIPLQNWVLSHPDRTSDLVLIVFDGTWKHAKEMVTASLPFLSEFAVRVSLQFDESFDGGNIFDSELLLRKEPFNGCMSTIEAVARSLAVLEGGSRGEEIEQRLVEVLRAMVAFQACYLKPLKPRTNSLPKKKGRGMALPKNGEANGLDDEKVNKSTEVSD